jgi:hypothetical protein
MRINLQQMFKQLIQMLWIAVWVGTTILIWYWTRLGAIAFATVGLALYLWALRKGKFTAKPRPEEQEPPDRAREAQYMVTQVLRNLTRVQVAYLCQDFAGRNEGLRWLKRAMPRGFGDADELQARLERARVGHEVEGMELTMRVMALRDELLQLDKELARLHVERPEHAVANPVIFVITEHLSEQVNEPLVVTLAGWNPEKRTLLPRVDALTFFSELDKGRQVRGQAEFDGARDALGQSLRVLSKEPRVYDAHPVEGDLASRGVKLSKVPLGFVIGTAELI